jgi:hypothetical protein
MQLGWIVMTLGALHGNAAAADLTVSVVSEGSMTTYPAKRIAGAVFRQAGLTVNWGKGTQPFPDGREIRLRVTLTSGTPAGLLPGALAFAHPFGGCSKDITVFFDRIQALTSSPGQESALLAYVLVHEITHVLQGMARHTEEGVMKASWSAEDRSRIFARRLAFQPDDVTVIREGLASGCTPAPGPLTARSGSGSALRPE